MNIDSKISPPEMSFRISTSSSQIAPASWWSSSLAAVLQLLSKHASLVAGNAHLHIAGQERKAGD